MDTSKFLEAYLQLFDFLNEEDIAAFCKITHVSTFDVGGLLIKEGRQHTSVHFLLHGLVRAYQTKESGEDRTLWIGEMGAQLADPTSLLGDQASLVNVEVVEPALVASFDKELMDALELKHPNLLRLKTISLQNIIQELYERIHFLNMLTPQERFQFLQQKHPDYFERIQQKHLASFIGVSEVHMSRLKKQYNSHQ